MTHLTNSLHPWIVRLFCTFAFVLPFSSKLASVILILIIIAGILYKYSEKKFFRFSSFISFWMLLYYIAHLTGLINTSNFSYAGLDLQIKLSFLLLPLAIDEFPISTSDFRRVARSLLAGCTLLSLILFCNALLEFAIWQGKSAFFHVDFCSVQHVAYLTLYINLSLFFLADEFFRLEGYRIRSRYLIITWMLFLMGIVTLLYSRTAEVTTMVTLAVYVFLASGKIGWNKRRFIASGSILTMMSTMIIVAYLLYNRYDAPPETQSVPVPTHTEEVNNSVEKNIRFEIWKNSLALIRENLLVGTGTGDIKDELMLQYEKAGLTEARTFYLNPHNQYLQTWLALGIPGMIILVMMMITIIRISALNRNYLLLCFGIAITLNMFTESMFEKQAGVLFITFFILLLNGLKNTGMKRAEA